jgi:serine protease Do
MEELGKFKDSNEIDNNVTGKDVNPNTNVNSNANINVNVNANAIAEVKVEGMPVFYDVTEVDPRELRLEKNDTITLNELEEISKAGAHEVAASLEYGVEAEAEAEAEQNNAAYSIVDQSNNSNENKKRNSSSSRRKFLPYIATGVISAFVGGMIMAGAALYIFPKANQAAESTTQASAVSAVDNTSSAKSNLGYLANTSTTNLSVVDIAKKVGPAVVGITVTTSGYTDQFGFSSQGQEGQGSGIIFSEDGYIVTNYHVVENAKTIVVTLNNNKEVKAKLINYDSENDLAVIKITDKTDIPGVAEFGDSDKLEAGELAVAIGNPLGKELLGSVTAGVISAVNRVIEVEGKKYTLVQTDAAINPGNSGGALVNSKGQVIGINSAKMGGDGLEGLGFAIPINMVKPKISDLTKPLLKIGISGIEITKALGQQHNLPIGIYIKDVTSFSAAERAGIQAGDVVVKFDGQEVKTVSDINKIKAKHKIGDTVKVELVRNGETKTIELKFVED